MSNYDYTTSMNFSLDSSNREQLPTTLEQGQQGASSAIEYEPKFKQHQEDLQNLFGIEVTSLASMKYPWVIDEFYQAAVKELLLGTPFALDYLLDEKLLTKKDIEERGITEEMRDAAKKIVATYKGPRLVRAKSTLEESGILSGL